MTYPRKPISGGKMSVPGVIVEERGSPNVVVRTSPTVPIFIGLFHRLNARGSAVVDPVGPLHKINDLLVLRSFLPNSVLFSVNIPNSGVPAVRQLAVQTSGLEIAHYFENGGGPCYLQPIASGSNTGYSLHMSAALDANLIAVTMTTGYPDTFAKEIAPLLADGRGRFFIANGGGSDTNPAHPGNIPAASKAHIAFYHPFLTVNCSHWRDDQHIPVTGHTDAAVTTLAQLKVGDPDLYKVVDSEIKKQVAALSTLEVTPSAAVAAAYCKTDRERGVWKAPANIVISNARPCKIVTEADQAPFNERGINVIRTIDGQTTIWGARTCEVADRQWRYVNVRRLFSQVERDIGEAMRAYVFEPNTPATWVRAKTTISHYLYDLWQLGAFQGTRPEDGYQVELGLDETMSATDVDEGMMVARIHLAPSKPAEFIVLQFSQQLQQA